MIKIPHICFIKHSSKKIFYLFQLFTLENFEIDLFTQYVCFSVKTNNSSTIPIYRKVYLLAYLHTLNMFTQRWGKRMYTVYPKIVRMYCEPSQRLGCQLQTQGVKCDLHTLGGACAASKMLLLALLRWFPSTNKALSAGCSYSARPLLRTAYFTCDFLINMNRYAYYLLTISHLCIYSANIFSAISTTSQSFGHVKSEHLITERICKVVIITKIYLLDTVINR